MTHSELEIVLRKLMEKEQAILAKKVETYSYEDNRFHTFQELSTLTGNKPPVIAFYLMLKHFIALKNWLSAYNVNDEMFITTKELVYIEEFIVDLRNYLALIYAMLYDVVEDDE